MSTDSMEILSEEYSLLQFPLKVRLFLKNAHLTLDKIILICKVVKVKHWLLIVWYQHLMMSYFLFNT